jgi:ribonuclease P protein component
MRTAQTEKGKIGWLIKRSDYLTLQDAARGAKRWVTPFFILQVRPHASPMAAADDCAWRVGFTTSRKVGSAVVRNRARRRLRELVRGHFPAIMKPHYDVVLIGRTAAASAPFDVMIAALDDAASKLKVHA